MEKTLTEVKPNICEKGLGKFKTFNISITEVEGGYECCSFTAKEPSVSDIVPRIVAAGLELTDDEIATIKEQCTEVTRGALIASLVRVKYSADDVEAIILNQGLGDECDQEYADLQTWRTDVKAIANRFYDAD